MRHFIVNHTKLYGEPGRTTNTTVAEWKTAVKKSFGLNYYNDMTLEILEQYATFYWVYELQEQYMYGSSRTSTKLSTGLGSVQRNLPLVQQVLNSDSLIYYSYANDSIRYMERGQKRYELSNHTSTKLSTGLGNVLAVVSDRKLVHCSGEELMWFEAHCLCRRGGIVSVSDYYPFGMEIKERTYVAVSASGGSVSSYRYGFNGQEKDDEVSGSGNSYTAEYWQYDSRLGRRWNVDPVVKEYESPYACISNNPIWIIDFNGADSTLYLVNIVGTDAETGEKTEVLNSNQEKQLKSETEAILKRQGLDFIKVQVIRLTEKEYQDFGKKLDGSSDISYQIKKDELGLLAYGKTTPWHKKIANESNYLSYGRIKLNEQVSNKLKIYALAYVAVHESVHAYVHLASKFYDFKEGEKHEEHNNHSPNINMAAKKVDFSKLKPGSDYERILQSQHTLIKSYFWSIEMLKINSK